MLIVRNIIAVINSIILRTVIDKQNSYLEVDNLFEFISYRILLVYI